MLRRLTLRHGNGAPGAIGLFDGAMPSMGRAVEKWRPVQDNHNEYVSPFALL